MATFAQVAFQQPVSWKTASKQSKPVHAWRETAQERHTEQDTERREFNYSPASLGIIYRK